MKGKHKRIIIAVFISCIFIGTSIVPAFSSDLSIINDGEQSIQSDNNEYSDYLTKKNTGNLFQAIDQRFNQSTYDFLSSRFQEYREQLQDNQFPQTLHRSQPVIIDGVSGQWDIIVPDDYTTIQRAIQASGPQNGYNIFVKNGIYNENIVINTDGISLTGESKEKTIINGYDNDNTITLNSNYLNISQFTIQHNQANYAGILFQKSSGNIIEHNIIRANENGIILIRSHGNLIQNNILINNKKGCLLDFCLIGNTIKNNLFLKNTYGVFVNSTCRSNIFYLNTFKNNSNHAYSLTSKDSTLWNNQTRGNYWDEYTGKDKNNDGIGDTPYIIAPERNQDDFPLMNPPNHFRKPIITITKPKENVLYLFDNPVTTFVYTLIIGKITIKIQAWENESKIDYIHLYINNKLQKNMTEKPYEYNWDQPTLGKQDIKIIAYDTTKQSSTKTLSVFKIA